MMEEIHLDTSGRAAAPTSFYSNKMSRAPLPPPLAPRAWYSQFATYLTSLGFIEANSDTSLFIIYRGLDMVISLT
jgi:hypothetical protein